MPPRASLVIPTRNRARFLARTLSALLGQRERAFEVIIADDGSEDDTRDVALGFRDQLDLRYLRRAAVGIAAARNAAMRAARGEVLIMCDDDRCAGPDFVADHLAAHADGAPRVGVGRQRGLFAAWAPDAAYTAADVIELVARDPALVPTLAAARAAGGHELVTPAMLRDDLAGALAAYELDEPWWEGHARAVIARWGTSLDGFAFPWTLGVGGNTSVPRALAEQVGLLDERFVGWGIEDTDFHYRLHRAGAATVMLAGGVNYHQVHRRGPERAWEWTRNAVRMLDKHPHVEVALYLAVCRRELDLVTANQVARDHAALGDAGQAIGAELVRVHREALRRLAAAGS